MKKIIMFPHNGCENHGCEAIIRATIKLLDFNKKDIILYSLNVTSDRKYHLDDMCSLEENMSNKITISNFQKYIAIIREKVLNSDRDIEELVIKHKKIKKYKKNSIALSIGGDNYCYSGMQHCLNEHIKVFDYYKINYVLWGCSFEEKLLNDEVIKELNKHKLIVTRESLSYELLRKNNVTTNIETYPDPAFVLDMEKYDKYDETFKTNNVIGINASGLIDSYDSYDYATFNNLCSLIDYLIENTNYKIMLIPHVRQKDLDDLLVLNKIEEKFNSNRIIKIDDDLNCMQLKYLISKCKQFIGCRTHSTIASYSTCVPTLAIGYSTKAKGICKDIFGSYEDLLVDAREFKSDNDLLNKYLLFASKENELREHLIEIMPEYINRAYKAVEALRNSNYDYDSIFE